MCCMRVQKLILSVGALARTFYTLSLLHHFANVSFFIYLPLLLNETLWLLPNNYLCQGPEGGYVGQKEQSRDGKTV